MCTIAANSMISKTAEYALRAVAFMAAQEDQSASANLLAEKTQAPRRYLHRVLQDLVKAALVSSRPGPGGGYVLTIAPKEITLLDVINAVSPIERINACPLGLKTHTDLCPLHSELDKVYAANEAGLKNVSLQNLLDSTKRIIPLCEAKHSKTTKRK